MTLRDDTKADPSGPFDKSLVAATAETMSPLGNADAPFTSGTPLLAVAEPIAFSVTFCARHFWSSDWNADALTPFAFAAASFWAE